MKDGRGASIEPAAIRLAAQGVGLDPDDILPLVAWAAIGLTHLCWRNSVLEDWHAGPDSRISDAEMMQANVATTRIFRRALGRTLLTPGPAAHRSVTADPGALAEAFEEVLDVAFAGDRVLPCGRTLLDVGGAEVEVLLDEADQQLGGLVQVAEEDGVETALLALALSGRTSCDGWWGSPRWPGIVDVVLRRLDDPADECWARYGDRPLPPEVRDEQRLRWLLLEAPDALAVETLEFLIGPVGIGFIRIDG